MTNQSTIGILGAGPVGSILAANFAKIKQPLVLIEVNDKRRESIADRGIIITGTDTIHSEKIDLLSSVEQLSDYPLDALFICTKTWSLKSILPELSKVVRPQTLIISFQNGIGPEDEIAKFFPPRQVARGIVNYAGRIVQDSGTVSMKWFNPPNYLGPIDASTLPRIEQIANILSKAGLTTNTIPHTELKKLVFFKTILNSALNALCASSGITMQQAMTYPHTRNLARLLICEGLTVAGVVGYSYGENAKDACMKYLDAGGDHLPSMWTDLKKGNPTEIEYINGKIVRIGLGFKINVDVNMFFTSAIVTQEIKTGVREVEDIPDYLIHF